MVYQVKLPQFFLSTLHYRPTHLPLPTPKECLPRHPFLPKCSHISLASSRVYVSLYINPDGNGQHGVNAPSSRHVFSFSCNCSDQHVSLC